MDSKLSFITASLGAPLDERGAPIDAAHTGVEVRESGVGDGSYTIRGHAAVFNKLSLDLGGFREKIAPTAFDRVLTEDPDVLGVWDHDTRYVLARTRNKTLDLRVDPYGLHTWMRVAPTSYAEDLRLLLERGDIDQASWMFTIERETWEITQRADGTEEIVATIEEVRELFDVTVTGRGAYPQTDMSIAHSRSHRLTNALHEGRVPGLTLDQARTRGMVAGDPERLQGSDATAPTGGTSERELLLARATAHRAFATRP